jgi:uncharacterized membrane protein
MASMIWAYSWLKFINKQLIGMYVYAVTCSARSIFLLKTQKYATEELGSSGSKTLNLDVCVHVTTHIVNNNILMSLYKVYIKIFLALMSILLYVQLLIYIFDILGVKFIC